MAGKGYKVAAQGFQVDAQAYEVAAQASKVAGKAGFREVLDTVFKFSTGGSTRLESWPYGAL